MNIRKTNAHDLFAILDLYKIVATQPGGIARKPQEIDLSYFEKYVNPEQGKGLCLVVETTNGELIAELHGRCGELEVFAHIMSDLTLCVHPNWQGQGIGKMLFVTFLEEVKKQFLQIRRVELVVRESNVGARNLYRSLGFIEEGRMEERIAIGNGIFEADIPMAWHR